MYESFSRVYRQIGLNMGLGPEKLSFFEAQKRALCCVVMGGRRLNRQARILDAATGTGDVLCLLRAEGYEDLEGIDGSQAMLDLWPRSGLSIPHECCDWTQTGQFFRKKQPFDFVFFMGHSLPHLPVADLPGVMKAVFEGLQPGGVIAFDLREWERRSDGQLVQPKKETKTWRFLQNITVCRVAGKVYERIDYTQRPDVEHVRYEVRESTPDGSDGPVILSDHLTYSIYTAEAAKAMLEAAGFMDVKIERAADWKYLIVHAVKPARAVTTPTPAT